MSESLRTVRATLASWRERGDDRFNPARFHAMDALARRAEACEGDLQRVLIERLGVLIAAYANDLPQASDGAGGAAPSTDRPLRALVEHIAQHAATRPVAAAEADAPAAFPQLPALDEFRQRWSTLRSESHLRQSQVEAPANAGPLNSGALVHRAITVMRELSPGYLQHFLSYVDHLAWLEQFGMRTAVPVKDTAEPAASPRKRTRSRKSAPRD